MYVRDFCLETAEMILPFCRTILCEYARAIKTRHNIACERQNKKPFIISFYSPNKAIHQSCMHHLQHLCGQVRN